MKFPRLRAVFQAVTELLGSTAAADRRLYKALCSLDAMAGQLSRDEEDNDAYPELAGLNNASFQQVIFAELSKKDWPVDSYLLPSAGWDATARNMDIAIGFIFFTGAHRENEAEFCRYLNGKVVNSEVAHAQAVSFVRKHVADVEAVAEIMKDYKFGQPDQTIGAPLPGGKIYAGGRMPAF